MTSMRWPIMATFSFALYLAHPANSQTPDILEKVEDYPVITLEINGEEGTLFKGDVTLYRDGISEQHPLAGSVPNRLSWEAEGIAIDLIQASQGSLELVLINNGSHSVSRVSGEGSQVRLSSR